MLCNWIHKKNFNINQLIETHSHSKDSMMLQSVNDLIFANIYIYGIENGINQIFEQIESNKYRSNILGMICLVRLSKCKIMEQSRLIKATDLIIEKIFDYNETLLDISLHFIEFSSKNDDVAESLIKFINQNITSEFIEIKDIANKILSYMIRIHAWIH